MDVVITQNNLQQFCRICLSYLQTSARNLHIRQFGEVKKLMVLLELDMSQDSVYPMRLCPPCYSKMIDIIQFRLMAVNSEEKLNSIIKSMGGCAKSDPNPSIKTWQTARDLGKAAENRGDAAHNGDITRPMSDDEETELILPEMAVKIPIKVEPSTECDEGTAVKMEIISDYEHDQESNAMGTAYDSIGNDGDDEENTLGNGSANSSSTASASTGSRKHSAPRLLRMRQRDRTKKSLQCPRCVKQVYKKVYLDAHIRGVHEGHKKPFLCTNCQKTFTRYNQLKQHMSREHLPVEKFICDQAGCVASFNMRSTLETHHQVVHSTETPVFAINYEEALELHRQRTGRENEIDHVCHQCSKKFSSRRALVFHLKRHFQIRDYVCSECGVAKVTRTELKTHMQIHNPMLEKIKCPICPAKFSHKNAIGRHVRVVHEGERKFPCSTCTKRFTTQSARREHERLHTGERPYQCNICDKGYAKMGALKVHQTTHDITLRKHVCTFCSRRFASRKNVVAHELRHVGDKPYLCTSCNLGFRTDADLEVHALLHLEPNE